MTGAPLRTLAALNWICHGVLALGLTAPCMTVVSRMGGATGLAERVGLLPPPRTYSILSGIGALFEHGDAALGMLLGLFSVVFPVAKLVIARLALGRLAAGGPPGRLAGAAAAAGKYSMADVFVIALVVTASKTFPGGSRVELEWGTFCFAAAALLSMIVSTAVSRAARVRPS